MLQALLKLLSGCILPILSSGSIVIFCGGRLSQIMLSAMLAAMLAARCILSVAGRKEQGSSVLSAVLIGACILIAPLMSVCHTARSSDQGHAP
ncbi:hypothetical protein [Xanthomonas oryzae]|uniref:Uncharacterized protein n=1 Tax=Xanthomonas oryzae pv. leersiae TaxID=3112258 RepID=A0AAJ6GZH5_9XANT|nr:hypothetical protein [Xanthomonas oryzae]QBG91406.1 hypothetical protein EYR26_07035 [Xanthomonas oryzae]WIX05696.1 hypothetical protein QN060_16040 [Xanthomonas oryzae pv. oryzae]